MSIYRLRSSPEELVRAEQWFPHRSVLGIGPDGAHGHGEVHAQAKAGDYVVIEATGAVRLCAPEAFEARYERLDDTHVYPNGLTEEGNAQQVADLSGQYTSDENTPNTEASASSPASAEIDGAEIDHDTNATGYDTNATETQGA